MTIEHIVKPILAEPDLDKDCERCGQPIIGEAAYCPLCNAQHHFLCWHENDGCAKRGCYCNTSNQEHEEFDPLSSTEDIVRRKDKIDTVFDVAFAFTTTIAFTFGLPYTIPIGAMTVWLFKDKK